MQKIARLSVLVFIFTIPWENAFTISTLGSLARIIGLVAAGIWIISVLFRMRLRKLQFFHIVVFSFVIINMISIFWTLDYDWSLARLKTYLQIGILAWILWDVFTTPESLRAAMQTFIFGGYVVIVSSFYNFVSGQTISQWEYGRFSGAGQNAVELGLILSLSLPVAWHLATTQTEGHGNNAIKIINFAFIPAALLAIVLTASRTALITIIPALFYIIGTMSRIKPVYRFLIFTLFTVGVFIGQSFVPKATLERLGTIGISIAGGDLGGRLALWKESLSIFKEHFLIGIGSGALNGASQLGAVAHNTFLSILAELGVIGFLLFLGVLAIVFFRAINQPKSYSVLWLTVLSIWLFGVQSLTYEYAKSTWFFLNMIVISAAIWKQHNLLAEDIPISENPRVNLGTPRPIPQGKINFPERTTLKHKKV